MRMVLLCAMMAMFAFINSAVKAEDKPAEAPAHVKIELPKADAEGWITLFNGKDLSGWDGDPNVWRVENGYISGKAEKVGGNTFLISDWPFKNFVIEAKCMLIKGKGFTNSGIQYRSKVVDPKHWVVGGYQADMGEGWWGANYEERGRGILWKPTDEATKAVKAFDEWNTYKITADGPHVKQEINGVVSGELDDKDEGKRALEGIFGLQYHAPGLGFEVRFKDIRIKILPDDKK